MTQTQWNLSLLYKNINDSKIELDLKKNQYQYNRFVKKYKNNINYLKNEKILAEALKDYEKLLTLDVAKPYVYLKYFNDLDSKNHLVEARLNLISEQIDKITNSIIFFPIALSKISKIEKSKFLKSKILFPYRYFLKTLFIQGSHTLSIPEEKLINLFDLPKYSLWIRGNEKLVNKQEILWNGKLIPINEASLKIHSLPTEDRRKLSILVNTKLKEIADFAESELNAVVIGKKISDNLRGYKKPYSETIIQYENQEKTVESLVKTVNSHFHLSHRFYKVKAKMLGLKKLTYADRAARVGSVEKKISFEEGITIVRNAFKKVNPLYSETFDFFLKNGQIDVFPRVGKKGGAYCSNYGTLPIFILLNYVNDFNSITTMAHEMGHALHGKFSTEHQRPLYRSHTIATAEVASTLFENFVFDEIIPTLSPKERIIALHDKIGDSIQTIFRQVACFNFEVELHNTVREQGSISKEKIATLMNKHMQSYLGPLFTLTDIDGYFFVNWSHIRRFFYVYSYAFGELVSSALYEKYKNNKNFESKIYTFLSSGGNESPENIFKKINIDVKNPSFFKTGLAKIEKNIEELEKLVF